MKYCFLRFPEGKSKAVTFSYDDGTRTDIKLIEIMNRYGIKGTFNINSRRIGEEGQLTLDEFKKYVVDGGHEIANHGAKHSSLARVSSAQGMAEVLEGRLGLEKAFGGFVRGYAYADCSLKVMCNGAEYGKIKQYLEDLGIAYARTLAGDNDDFLLPQDWFAWMPTAHHKNPQIFEYIDKFSDINPNSVYWSERYPRLFYLWGHSSEFEGNGNWDRFEEICKLLSGKADTWYATNIEIYNYVKAYDSLVFSADGEVAYNPSLVDVYVAADERNIKIPSGKTVNLLNEEVI